MIHHQVSVLKERGVDAAELIVEPEPLSAAALFRRGAGPGGAVLPSREMAERAFQALRAGGFVTPSLPQNLALRKRTGVLVDGLSMMNSCMPPMSTARHWFDRSTRKRFQSALVFSIWTVSSRPTTV